MLRRYFELARCEVSEAATIDEALSMVAAGVQPHLITLDLNLGVGGATATLARVIELKVACPDAVIIVMSGVVDASAESRVISAGAHGMILKSEAPIGGNVLVKLGQMLRNLVSSPGPNLLNIAVAEALAARFSEYVKHQAEPEAQT